MSGKRRNKHSICIVYDVYSDFIHPHDVYWTSKRGGGMQQTDDHTHLGDWKYIPFPSIDTACRIFYHKVCLPIFWRAIGAIAK